MNLPNLDRALLSGRLARFAQSVGIYDSKTDQTAQTYQCIETTVEFGAPPGQKLTRRAPKLTSETAQQPDSRVQAGAPLDSTDACTSDGGLQP